MSNRNFDNSAIILRRLQLNYSRNLYQNNANGVRLVNNSQNSNSSASQLTSFVPGAQTLYFQGLQNGPKMTSLGGIFGIHAIPLPTAPISQPPSDPSSDDRTLTTQSRWVQCGLDIDGEASDDVSGYSVSLSADGSIVAIGAPFNTGVNGSISGQVRVYKNIEGVWTQVGEDIDGEAAEDNSGYSVSLSADGSIVAIGARFNDGNGDNSGHVRVYRIINNVWVQMGQDIDGEAAQDNSGWSVSLSDDGTIVAIGAIHNDGNGSSSGQVRIYKIIDNIWTQQGQDIDGEAVSNLNGVSVSLSANGSTLAIGAIGNNGNGIYSGKVRIYKNICGVWAQVGQDIVGEAARDQSGWSVSLSLDGSIVAIGAKSNDGNGSSSGHVRVYRIINNVWTQQGGDIDGEAADNNSGQSVSLNWDGTIVAIGAHINNGNGTGSGHVRVYKFISNSWEKQGQDIDGEVARDQSGYSVSLNWDGSIVAIGAPFNTGNVFTAGHVRIYKNDSLVQSPSPFLWNQVGQDIDGEAAGDGSGLSVSISADGLTIAIGAPGNDNGPNLDYGHVRVYKNINGVWNKVGQDIDGESAGDDSGRLSLSADGSIVAIGAYGNDNMNGTNSGHVRVYKLISNSWTQLGTDIDGEADGDGSGLSVSLSANGYIVAIGAPTNDGNGINSGHVRVYRFNGISWDQIGGDIDGEAIYDTSGRAVSLSADGSIVAIGAPTNSSMPNELSGQVRVYKFINNSWDQLGGDIDGEASYSISGLSVSLSIDGSIVAIGAPSHSVNGLNSGKVRVYKNINNVWTQQGQDINGEAAGDECGRSVSLNNSGDVIAIGVTQPAGGRGKVRVYKNINGIWTKQGQYITGEAAGDQSGFSVGLNWDGSIVAIGGRLNAGNGYNSGHVRVYKNDMLVRAPLWTQIGQDIDGENLNDESGYSVSLNADGTIVAIGSINNSESGVYSGHVRVYKNIGGKWIQQGQDIDGEAIGDESGYSVSLSDDGTIIAIGAPVNDGNGIYSGHVRVYKFNNNIWEQQGSDIDGEVTINRSGSSVSLSTDGLTIAIGAILNNGVNGTGSGHVRVYKFINNSWAQLGDDIDGEAAGDNSGRSVSLSSDGSTVAIGGPFNNGNSLVDSGHVRVYKFNGTSWDQLGSDIDGEAAGDWSGHSVSLSSDGLIVAIGAPRNGIDNKRYGHVRVYKFNGTDSWVQQGLDIDGEVAVDYSGYSVSLSDDGSIVAIGAPYNTGSSQSSGHVRVYKFSNNTWVQQDLDIDGEAIGNWSGWSVSLSANGSTVAIGARLNDGINGSNSGHVRVYKNCLLDVQAPAPAVQLLTNPDFTDIVSDGAAGWTSSTGWQVWGFDAGTKPTTLTTMPERVGVYPTSNSTGFVIFSFTDAIISQTVSIISLTRYSTITGVLNIVNVSNGSTDKFTYQLQYKNSEGTVLYTSTTGSINAPSTWTDHTLTLTRASFPNFDQIKSITVSITSKDTGYWNGQYGPAMDYCRLTIS